MKLEIFAFGKSQRINLLKLKTHLTTSIINLSPAQSLRIATLSHWNVTEVQPSSSSSPIA
jgi:hypothetical protein